MMSEVPGRYQGDVRVMPVGAARRCDVSTYTQVSVLRPSLDKSISETPTQGC